MVATPRALGRRRSSSLRRAAGSGAPSRLVPAPRAAAGRCHGVRICGPSAVIATVNSKCAAGEPSCGEDRPAVAADAHGGAPGGGHRLDREHHALLQQRALAGLAVVGHLRILVHAAPDAVSDERAHRPTARRPRPPAGSRSRRRPCGCPARHCATPACSDSSVARSRFCACSLDLVHREGARGVGHPAVERHADVDRDDVARASAGRGRGCRARSSRSARRRSSRESRDSP